MDKEYLELQNLVSEYKEAKAEHCDWCGIHEEECEICKPEFNKLRKKAKAIYERALNWEGCGLCAKERKANQDEIKLLELCQTCQNLINQIKQLYEETFS